MSDWIKDMNRCAMTDPTSESAKPSALQIVHEQAGDEGLWFEEQTAPEAYLQQELRRLHAAVERASAAPQESVAWLGASVMDKITLPELPPPSNYRRKGWDSDSVAAMDDYARACCKLVLELAVAGCYAASKFHERDQQPALAGVSDGCAAAISDLIGKL